LASQYFLDASYYPAVKLYLYPVRVVWRGGEDPADNPFGQLAARLIPFFDDPDFVSYFDIGSLSSIWHKGKEHGEIE
jgi:hypothetical protein